MEPQDDNPTVSLGFLLPEDLSVTKTAKDNSGIPNPKLEAFDPKREQSVTSSFIAKGIFFLFATTVLGTLMGDFVVLYRAVNGRQIPIEDLVTKSMIPLLTAVATMGTTLFGPLLAFVLGYYFGENKRQN